LKRSFIKKSLVEDAIIPNSVISFKIFQSALLFFTY
jgi:hypothetical protein